MVWVAWRHQCLPPVALPALLRAAGEAPPEVAEQKPARARVEERAGVEEAVTVSEEARLSAAAPTS